MEIKYKPITSAEQKSDYKTRLRETKSPILCQIFFDAYLDRDFPTEFERWMAFADVAEFRARLDARGMLG